MNLTAKKPRNRNPWPAIRVILFFALIVALMRQCAGQVLGINGAGFFENRTEQSDIWLREAVGEKTFALRVPGGAIAKFADPDPDVKGWGLNYAGIDSIQIKYGSPEEEDQAGALEKWHRKADAQPQINYLAELVQMQKDFPNMQVIYTANVFIPASRTLAAIDYLLANGVHIVGVELGNETYSQVNYDFILYWNLTMDLRNGVHARRMKVYHPVPATTGTRNAGSHERWVASLVAVIDTDGVVFHPYYDEREFPHLAQPVDTSLAYAEIAAFDFDAQFTSMLANFPHTKDFIITECNTQPSGLIGDTPLNAFFVSRLLAAAQKFFQYVCLHSGVAPDKYGIIYGTKTQVRNTSYYAFKDALAAQRPLPVYGCMNPYAVNYNDLATVDDGSCYFDIPGCTDPAADNYNPEANLDNFTCIYYGCMDPKALNYDDSANAEVGGSCLYPPPVKPTCVKRWWQIFKKCPK